MKKRVISIIAIAALLVTMVLGVAGCSAKKDQGSNNDKTPAAQPEKEIVIKLGHGSQLESPLQSTSMKFKELIEQRTNNKVKVEVFGNRQLGEERDMVEGLQLGTVDMTIVSTGPLGSFVPELGIIDLPFLFTSNEHAYKVLDGEIGQGLLKKFEAKGIVGLSFMETGWRNITSNKKITVPADLKGLKIRTMENKVHMASFEAMGAAPVPMVWGEVYTGLQQKVIDGQENPVQIIYANALWDVQKYVTLTGHFYGSYAFLMSKKTMDKLPADIQKIVLDTAKEVTTYERNLISELEDGQKKTLIEKGMEINEIDKKVFQDACKDVYTKFEGNFGKENIQKIIDLGAK